jgi:ribosomal protein S7
MNKERYVSVSVNQSRSAAYDKFVATLMKNGNRCVAETITRKVVALIKVKEEKDGLAMLFHSMKKAKPLICGALDQRSKARKTKIVPIPSNRGRRLAIQ